MGKLDGNAIASMLWDVFGQEMTLARGTCATCGRDTVLAETAVYRSLMGTVLRCRFCGSGMAVITRVRGCYCVNVSGVRQLTVAG